MTLPPFSAEASLAPTRGVYRGATCSAHASTGDPSSVQASAAGIGVPWPVFKCCRRAPMLGGRFVCVSRPRRPWESCRCLEGAFGPLIVCRDIGNTADF